MEEIQVTKSLYPEAGKKYHKSAAAACRQIERQSVLCWEMMSRKERQKYLGKTKHFPAPAEMVFLLAYYCQYNRSYEDMLEEQREALFKNSEIV